MFTVRLHLAEKCYTATERNIKLAQRTAAQLALNDCRNVSSMNNNTDEDLLQLNSKLIDFYEIEFQLILFSSFTISISSIKSLGNTNSYSNSICFTQ